MLGQRLSDRYQITQPLSSGGFGNTYLAQDMLRPGHPICVVKQLCPAHRDPARMEIARRQFNLEAVALEKIGSHSQIPQLLAYFECNKEFYLVEEYIQGKPLQKEIHENNQPWTDDQVVRLLLDLLTVLDYIHGQNVIHRDIKPSNLIRRAVDQKLVLIDFGAVKLVEAPLPTPTPHHQPDLTKLSIVIGTPGYMPTEQMSGKPQRVSDIYALGIVASELLTGLQVKQFRLDAQNEVAWPRYEDTDPQLHRILQKMTRLMPQNRYQSAAEVLDDLRALEIAAVPHAETVQNLPTTVITDHQGADVSKGHFSDLSSHANSNGSDLKTTIVSPALNNQLDSTNGALDQSGTVSPAEDMPNLEQGRNEKRQLAWFPWAKKISAIAVGMGLAVVVFGFGKHHFAVENQKERLEDIKSAHARDDLENCVQNAKDFPTPDNTKQFKEANEMEGTCQFALGKKHHQEGKLKEAIAALRAVPKDTRSYVQTVSLMDDWSEDIMKLGQASFDRGITAFNVTDLRTGFRYLQDIPQDTKLAKEVGQTRDRWSGEIFSSAVGAFDRAEKIAQADAALLMMDAIPQAAKNYQKSQQEMAVMRASEKKYRALERQIDNHLTKGECAPAKTLVGQLEAADYTGWRKIAGKKSIRVGSCFIPIDAVKGELTSSSTKYKDRFLSEKHSWQGVKGKRVLLDIDSDDFRPFLLITNVSGREEFSGYSYSGLGYTPSENAKYYVTVVSPTGAGTYTLTLKRND